MAGSSFRVAELAKVDSPTGATRGAQPFSTLKALSEKPVANWSMAVPDN
jgi:hypothetical protein